MLVYDTSLRACVFGPPCMIDSWYCWKRNDDV